MNERHVVEDLVLIGILLKAVQRGVADLADASSVTTVGNLQRAAAEILATLPHASRPKVLRRVRSLGSRCVGTHVPIGTPIVQLGLAAYVLLDHLLEEGYIDIGGASPLSAALDMILPSLEPAAAMDGYMEKGRTLAAAIFADLGAEGLFKGVRRLG